MVRCAITVDVDTCGAAHCQLQGMGGARQARWAWEGHGRHLWHGRGTASTYGMEGARLTGTQGMGGAWQASIEFEELDRHEGYERGTADT